MTAVPLFKVDDVEENKVLEENDSFMKGGEYFAAVRKQCNEGRSIVPEDMRHV